MCPGKPQLVSKKVDQEQATLDLLCDFPTVHRHGHLHPQAPSPLTRATVASQRSLRELVRQMTLVLGAATHVGRRTATLGGNGAGLGKGLG